MRKADNPCVDCSDRCAGCHDRCERYLAAREAHIADRLAAGEYRRQHCSPYVRDARARAADKSAKRRKAGLQSWS